ncbi:RNA-directed RNA polymerase [Parastagonospora nodorum]|nr:RNA-directed RNA polymerase [Parastagonospora nodorum]KAH6275000.1 RNA-directed RNA polymerase [Parastagonospora nodorum]
MEWPNFDDSTRPSRHLTFRSYHDWDALPSQLSTACSQVYSEHSSDSGTSFGSRKNGSMNRDNASYRGGRGGRSRSGFSGARGGRKNSSSSSSSNGQQHPVIRQSPAPQSSVTPPAHHGQGNAHVDSPITPNKQQSSYTVNGTSISETYTPSGSAHVPSPRPRTEPSTPTRSNYMRNTPTHQHVIQQPAILNDATWAHQQELRFRLLGIPKACWTKQVYQAVSSYGTVVRIKILPGSPDNDAWVVFRAPLYKQLPYKVRVGHALARCEKHNVIVRKVPSPIDPKKQYCEFNTLLANTIDFGATDAKKSMIKMHSVRARRNVRLTLNLDRKELDIQFPQDVNDELRNYRFRLPIALLSHIYKDAGSAPGQGALIIPFESAPQFFVQKQQVEILSNDNDHTSFSTREETWLDWYTWFRETDIVESGVRAAMQERPLMNHKDMAIIDIGRWTTYRILLDNAIFTKPQYTEFASALADYGVEIKDCSDYDIKNRMASPLWKLLQEETSGTHPHLEAPTSSSGFDELFAGQIYLSFPIRYQLEACLSNGYLKEHTVTAEFLERLAKNPRRAVYLLEKVVDKQETYYDPMEIFEIRTRGSLEKKVPSYCLLQRSAIITPSTIHVASPIMETSNRITREYAAIADRFLRVKFSDEKTEGVLRSIPNGKADATFDRVRRAMKNGIVVAGRYYEFLAFGNSQFREHGAYFYAPTSTKSADDIRSSLGRFDHIKTVAKFGARLGQCFSTTRAMRVKVTIVKIPDIERNGYCFTDGVGKLSLFLAQMAAQELGLSNAFDDPPSLYQFRLGGCKGVLALDPKITGNEVHIRPSQLKFEAKFLGLEIIRSSALATPFFNRQIIVVLSDLGVPDNVLIQKQQEMVNDYEQAMTDKDTAIAKLRKHIDMNQTTLTMAGMVIDGFMKSREPFMMSLLRLWRAATIKNLKEKARIAIEDGAFVLGCVDESGTLKGHLNDPQSRSDASRQDKMQTLPEIFLQVDDTEANKRGHYKIVKGVCVLARNPSLHPGDLRVVRAVDVPALHHLKNVVVLPQTGDRDLANMCSGGDLDGDDYMVLWDKDLIPELINVAPMDFTPEKPVEKEGPITVSDISDFFVTYMQNDSLGQIAYAHLAQADVNHEGVGSGTCLELAKLHSQAVDYPKSGIPAQMSQDLRPKRWPHFMEKKHLQAHKIYRSTRVLGKLYDQVELVDFKPQWENAFDFRILDAYEVDEELLSKATDIKALYDEAFKRLMAKHGIRTEFEAWSVFVLAHNQESRDYKFAEEFGRTMGALKAQYQEICREAAEMTNAADWNRLGPFVAAMYKVTGRELEAALAECRAMKVVGGLEVPARLMDAEHMPLMSFPWLFPSELGKIATRKVHHVKSHASFPRSLPHRKKPTGHSGTDVGDVETEEGTVHYGELLKLDFGMQVAVQPAEPQHTAIETKNQKKQVYQDGTKQKNEKEESGHAQEKADQDKSKQKKENQDKSNQERAKNDSLGRLALGGTYVLGPDASKVQTQTGVGEGNISSGGEQEGRQQQDSLDVKVPSKKPSVLEMLSRFG